MENGISEVAHTHTRDTHKLLTTKWQLYVDTRFFHFRVKCFAISAIECNTHCLPSFSKTSSRHDAMGNCQENMCVCERETDWVERQTDIQKREKCWADACASRIVCFYFLSIRSHLSGFFLFLLSRSHLLSSSLSHHLFRTLGLWKTGERTK